jgi:hypothetical protein
MYVRMHALQYASDYITYLDSDDELKPEIIQKTMDKMLSTDCNIVIFNAEYVYTNGKREPSPVWSAMDDFNTPLRDE